MSFLLNFAIKTIAQIVIGSSAFNYILDLVQKWSQERISGAEKRNNVLAEIEIIGLKVTESAARLGIELAVQYIKRKAA